MGDIIFIRLPSLFQSFVDTFKNIINSLSLSIGEMYQRLADELDWGDTIRDIVENIITSNELITYIWDVPLISLLVGGFVTIYMLYQFVTWILNIIT